MSGITIDNKEDMREISYFHTDDRIFQKDNDTSPAAPNTIGQSPSLLVRSHKMKTGTNHHLF